jgi:outer membrane protein assembly factor BamB
MRLAPLALLPLVLAAGAASADERCSLEERQLLCPNANPACPPGAGPAASAWPLFQHDAQHTGRSELDGPACNRVIWRWSGTDEFLSPPTVGADGTIYVGNARFPVCAIDPATGATRWCDTDQEGRLADRSSPAVADEGTVYIGTRDNDLWAIQPQASPVAQVLWRQKVCTDGDVTTSPAIGADGVIYMGSDSLNAGWFFAMCPGATQQVKWCTKLGGGVKNVSPALSPDGATVYVTTRGTTLHALDAATGAERWRRLVERRPNAARWPNYTPVVSPATGNVYLGFDEGLFEVTPDGTVRLLFATDREKMESPPALGADGTLYVGASRGSSSTFYAIRPDGSLRWSYALPRGPGRFRNNQAVIGAGGSVYVAVKNTVYAFAPDGDGSGNGVVLWRFDEATSVYQSSPIIGAPGRLYVGSGDRLAPVLYAIGDCP